MATSLTVPQTDNLPMSPPGKKNGDTTCESSGYDNALNVLSYTKVF